MGMWMGMGMGMGLEGWDGWAKIIRVPRDGDEDEDEDGDGASVGVQVGVGKGGHWQRSFERGRGGGLS